MKHRFAFLSTLWWVLLCGIAGLFLMLTSGKQSRFSAMENRMLAGFPEVSAKSFASGDFMENFESFLTDGFIARNDVIDLTERALDRFSVLSDAEKLENKTRDMETALDEDLKMNADPDVEDVSSLETENATVAADVPAAPASSTSDDAPEEIEDKGEDEVVDAGEIPLTATNSYIWYDKTDGTRVTSYKYRNSDIKNYSDTLRMIQSYLPEDGVICFTQVPLASMATRWTGQQDAYRGWGSSVETVLEKCLEGTERIYVFSTFDLLAPHLTGETKMFYDGDHHWTPEGAYVVFAEMMKRQGLPVTPYDEYRYKVNRTYDSDGAECDRFNVLYPLLPGNSYVVTQRTQAEEVDLMNYDYAGYLAFMNNSRRPWRRIVTGADVGRKALVICDSFGNAFTPYLLPYYDEVHMCDFRADRYNIAKAGGSIGDNMRYFGIDDVYIITSTANGLRKDNSLVSLPRLVSGQ